MVQPSARRRSAALQAVGKMVVWLLVAATVLPGVARAHEGHAALPTKGLTVLGDELLLSEGAREAIDLRTSEVVLVDMPTMVTSNARVELPWQQQAMITTQVPGRIGEVLARPGEPVEAGQTLATVESLELESLQLAMLQAQAELMLAEQRSARQRSLASQGVIAGSAARESDSDVRRRQAELTVTACKLRALGLSQELLDEVSRSETPVTTIPIVSPIRGVVAEADVRAGQLVHTTEHLFHVVNLSRLWALGDVLEGKSTQLGVGQPVAIRFKSLPGVAFPGTIDHLHLKIDAKRRTRGAAVSLDNAEGLLRPGMFGQMEIEVERAREAIAAPTESIIRYLDAEYVLLKRGEGKLVRRRVETGVRHDQRVEILAGLFPGDHVVVTGNHLLFSLFANETPRRATDRRQLAEDAARAPAASQLRSASDQQGTIVLQGVVELPTAQKAFASSRVEGRIRKILVRHSQSVQAGDVLAEVASLELANLQGELLEAQARLAWTSERVGRLESLARQNVTAKKELWQLQTNQSVLENQVASVTRRLAMLGVPESEITRIIQTELPGDASALELLPGIPIRTSIGGRVSAFDVVPGQIVDADDSLFEIHDASTVWVKGYLFQPDATYVHAGQEASVTFHALPGATVRGNVVRISPVLDAGEPVLPLWIGVDNDDGQLIEGMLARVEIPRGVSAVERAASRRLDRDVGSR